MWQVVAIKDDQIFLHYPCWSAKWDIWVHVESEKIAPHRTHTIGPNINPNNPSVSQNSS
jgi:hypothetical protein